MRYEYLLPRALYLPSNVKDEPAFDTLIAVCNPYGMAQKVELHFYDLNGDEVAKSPLVRVLEPGHSFATTLIPNNIFPDPPQNFQGYAKIAFPDGGLALPAIACLGGNGPTPLNWNYSSPNVPLYDTKQTFYSNMTTRMVFPYLIPFFFDANQHAGDHAYRTGISITNLDSVPAKLRLTYTVGDIYPEVGQKFEADIVIPPGSTFVKQMHEIMPVLASFNSEGWLDIVAQSSVNIMAYLLPANKSYQFFGFGQAPFVLA